MDRVRLLHLEDSPQDAELIRERIDADGLSCDVTWLTDKESFESALSSNSFDVVLCDYSLPGYNGLDALKFCLATQPDVPAIIISGALGDIEAVECLKAGATDYVLKQQLERLAPAIRRSLREAKERRSRVA